MTGLNQAGKVANNRLVEYLAKYGYAPVPRTPALWRHNTRDITFTLCVDNFVVKYTQKTDVDQLLNAIRNLYTILFDWKGEIYIGLTFSWDYLLWRVRISMPVYIADVLLRFKHTISRKEHRPHKWHQPIYRKQQLVEKLPESPYLLPDGVLYV